MPAQNVDILQTMKEDLKRALGKPFRERRWGMVIDTRKCIGCRSCTVGCMSENVLPPGIVYRPVFETEEGPFPKVRRAFFPRPCMHCERPPCVGVCPKKGTATYRSAEGVSAGMVLIDYRECIRCDRCIRVCPYRARGRDEGRYHAENAPAVPEYERRPSAEYGGRWPRDGKAIPVGTARKCHFCLHRVREGILPVCVTTCNGRATYFGDIRDPAALVAKVRAANTVVTIRRVLDPDPARNPLENARDLDPLAGIVVFGGSMTRPSVTYILADGTG